MVATMPGCPSLVKRCEHCKSGPVKGVDDGEPWCGEKTYLEGGAAEGKTGQELQEAPENSQCSMYCKPSSGGEAPPARPCWFGPQEGLEGVQNGSNNLKKHVELYICAQIDFDVVLE